MTSQLVFLRSTDMTVVTSVRSISAPPRKASPATAIATREIPVGSGKRLLPSFVALRAVPRRPLPRSDTWGRAVAHVDGVLYDIELLRASAARSTGPGLGLFSARKRTWTTKGHATHSHTR